MKQNNVIGTTSFMFSQSFSQLITVNLQYNGIKTTKQCSEVNCVKSVRIQGWSGSYYTTFFRTFRTLLRYFNTIESFQIFVCFFNVTMNSKNSSKHLKAI